MKVKPLCKGPFCSICSTLCNCVTRPHKSTKNFFFFFCTATPNQGLRPKAGIVQFVKETDRVFRIAFIFR